MEAAERRQLLWASEKPLRADRFRAEKARGEPGSIDPRAGKSGFWGAERRIVRRSCLQVLYAGHAGREPGWKSGHLEPFSFGGSQKKMVAVVSFQSSVFSANRVSSRLFTKSAPPNTLPVGRPILAARRFVRPPHQRSSDSIVASAAPPATFFIRPCTVKQH